MSNSSNKMMYSSEAEQGVIGAILLDTGIVFDVMSKLQPDDFYNHQYRTIFESIYDLSKNGSPIDTITLSNNLKEKNADVDISIVTEAINAVFTAANASEHCQIIKQYSKKRKLIAILEEKKQSAINGEDGVLEQTLSSLVNLQETGITKYSFNQNELMEEFFDELAKRKNLGGMAGTSYGYADLDTLTHGAKAGELIIISARPSVGKSAWLDNVSYKMLSAGRSIFFVSVESNRQELMNRMLGRMSGIGHNKLMEGLDESHPYWKDIKRAEEKLRSYSLTVNDNPQMTTDQILFEASKLKAQEKLDVIFVDYLQMLGDRVNLDNEVQRVSKISKNLKKIARELHIPVIVACQLNRQSENRSDRKPKLSDLRESGQIEQDADVVIGMWRENLDSNITNFTILKQRHGPLADFSLHFDGFVCEFREIKNNLAAVEANKPKQEQIHMNN